MTLKTRTALVASIIAVVAAFGTFTAANATADQIWYQSVGRSSPDALCPTSTDPELAAGWTQWASSWEQWIGGGRGGYVCSRQILWAKDEPVTESPSPAISRCLPYAGGFWMLFGAENYLPSGGDVYSDSSCTSFVGTYGGMGAVYASGPAEANILCATHFTPNVYGWQYGYSVYDCQNTPQI